MMRIMLIEEVGMIVMNIIMMDSDMGDGAYDDEDGDSYRKCGCKSNCLILLSSTVDESEPETSRDNGNNGMYVAVSRSRGRFTLIMSGRNNIQLNGYCFRRIVLLSDQAARIHRVI